MTIADPAKAPWHLWVAGVLSLLWNAFGAYDYLMSVTRNEAYLSQFPPAMIALLDSFPAWATAAWATGVWASLAGSVLLLLRSRFAATAFAVSFVGALVSFAYQFTLPKPPELSGGVYTIMPVIIMVVIAAQWYYASRLGTSHVLR